jgi:hypothetical protein
MYGFELKLNWIKLEQLLVIGSLKEHRYYGQRGNISFAIFNKELSLQ